jgi:hypothetical protein
VNAAPSFAEPEGAAPGDARFIDSEIVAIYW